MQSTNEKFYPFYTDYGHVPTQDDRDHEYAALQEEIDGVKEALAEWECA